MRATELRLTIIEKLLDRAKHSLMEGDVRNAIELAFRAYEEGVDLLSLIKGYRASKHVKNSWDAVIKQCSQIVSKAGESSSPSKEDVESLVACAEEVIAIAKAIHGKK